MCISLWQSIATVVDACLILVTGFERIVVVVLGPVQGHRAGQTWAGS